MAGKLSKYINFISNQGLRYVSFRIGHELMKKAGLLKRRYPSAPAYKQYLTLAEWKVQPAHFFFADKEALNFPRNPVRELKATYEQIKEGKLLFFNSTVKDLGKDFDWVTNVDSGYHYGVQKHWTEIEDYSKEAGDIKFVWEKSRFSYLYDIIRYDYHYNTDCSKMVFDDIASWIKSNPINMGPNYRCSQEMSLRVLNWTYALHYYRNSSHLTDEVFNQMQYAIYWHMHHVYNNIDFSRISVRNNHAITETLTLYLAGLLYPTLPGAETWKKKGKAWFEQEVAYQIYEDGTFLQYSMNYHRIVAQLLTWAITLADLNKEKFKEVVYTKAKRTFVFLRTCMIDESGYLPNYGANDGALFFRLNNADFRDYRPQLQALAACIGNEARFYEANEDSHWYGIFENARKTWVPTNGAHSFANGGYYVIREPETLTLIKCGSYKDRPQQADNLHIDIWHKGENVIPDGGSYKYNTDNDTIRYFSGTASHNTVMIDDKDQMLKGGRFIWFFWSQAKHAELKDNGDNYSFDGEISAFTYINKNITHRRKVVKKKGELVWVISDEITHLPAGMKMRQLWHVLAPAVRKVNIKAKDKPGNTLKPTQQDGWTSAIYGQREKTAESIFSSDGNTIDTTITISAK